MAVEDVSIYRSSLVVAQAALAVLAAQELYPVVAELP